MKKTKTRQEVAEEYGIYRKTLTRRIEAAGVQLSQPRGVLLTLDLVKIYRALGLPQNMSPGERALWLEEIRLYAASTPLATLQNDARSHMIAHKA